jgi:hypothetical protein
VSSHFKAHDGNFENSTKKLVGSRVARFFLSTTYHNGKKYTKWPQNIPNCPKIGCKISHKI